MTRIFNLLFLISVLLLVVGCEKVGKKADRVDTGSVIVIQKNNIFEMDNGLVKVRIVISDQGIEQEYFALKSNEWISVVRSFRPPAQQWRYWRLPTLYDSDVDKSHRLIVSVGLDTVLVEDKNSERSCLKLSGKLNSHTIEQKITLGRDEEFFHIDVSANLASQPAKLEYLLSPFEFNLEEAPDFVHTPTIKFEEDDIIGDRVFYSPAIILQKGGLFCALVPDLDLINAHKVLSPDARQHTTGEILSVPHDRSRMSMPTGMDLQLKSPLTTKPIFSYGFIDNIPTHHMRWVHPNDGSMVKNLDNNQLCYGFDLFISAEAPNNRGYQRINKHIWRRFGSPTFKNPKPQAMPFAEYAKVIYPATFNYKGGDFGWSHNAPKDFKEMGGWVQFEMNGQRVGGYRNVAPFWYDVLSNGSWWNNTRDAVGLYFWGKRLNDESLIDKARQVINLAMQAPQENGLFPIIYQVQRKRWVTSHFDPPMQVDYNIRPPGFMVRNISSSYHTIPCSKTGAHLLRYLELCEDDPRIVPYLRRYGDFLVEHIDSKGRVPAWFNQDFKPNPHLYDSGEGGVHVWFLSKLYQATGDNRYLQAAERIAEYIIKEVLPTQRWRDVECYFSCGGKPLNFYDSYQNQEPRGCLAMFWAAEGFASLYSATGENGYLDAGEQVIDYVTLYQTVWQPHYIWAYAFGGTDTDNGDAAWLNSHQTEIVQPLLWYAIELGRQDLLERAVAAARASVVLINHPRHIQNETYKYPNYPYGLGPENIDHEGHSQNCGRTSSGWGEGSGISAGVADALRNLGSAYVNFAKNLAVGVDGVEITSFKMRGNTILIELENKMAALPFPYEKNYRINLKIVGLDEQEYQLVINNSQPKKVSVEQLANFSLEIKPNLKESKL